MYFQASGVLPFVFHLQGVAGTDGMFLYLCYFPKWCLLLVISSSEILNSFFFLLYSFSGCLVVFDIVIKLNTQVKYFRYISGNAQC